MRYPIQVTLALLLSSTFLSAADYYVAPSGNDSAAGSQAAPFRTITKAAAVMRAGDTCYIHEGRYRESVELKHSGTKGKPIRFIAVDGDKVVIDGTRAIDGEWQKHQGKIWKTSLDGPQVEQLFVDDMMQLEARWPDSTFQERWKPSHWAKTGSATRYGKIQHEGLKPSTGDWTGGIAILNVGPQWFTWSRTITSHQQDEGTFTYDADLKGLGYLDPVKGSKRDPNSWAWKDDYFYLTGKLHALTVPTEWFHDPDAKTLYYMPTGDTAPQGVSVKIRDFGISAENIEYVHLQGIEFFACAFTFTRSRHIQLDNCHLRFPNYRRRLLAAEQEPYKGHYPTAKLDGEHNQMRTCSIRYAGASALSVTGANNLVENSIISDGCWSGTLHYSLVKMGGEGNVVRRNTISWSGSPLLQHWGSNLIELNHVHTAGMTSKDISAIYSHGDKSRNSIIRYNWVHGVRSRNGKGLGIRGDDVTRGQIVHHNVVWDIGSKGMIVKGDENQVFNNTVFPDITVPTQAEPRKPWKGYHHVITYVDVQNKNSIIANNLVGFIKWRREKISAPGIQANHELGGDIGQHVMDSKGMDFRIKPDVLKTLPKPFKIKTGEGAKIDTDYLGAYDPNKPAWKPGADWELVK